MAITPGRLDMTIVPGSTFRQTLPVYEGLASDPTVTTISGLNPFDLTGFTGVVTLRTAAHRDPPLYQMTSENGGIIILSPPTAGVLQLYIPAVETIGFTFHAAVYDFFLTDNNGNYTNAGDIIPFLWGQFRVRGFSP